MERVVAGFHDFATYKKKLSTRFDLIFAKMLLLPIFFLQISSHGAST